MPARPQDSDPDVGAGGTPVPVVVVDSRADMHRVPPGLERSFDPGAPWVVPAGVALGLALVAATWSIDGGSRWRLVAVLAGLTFAAAWGVVALALGGARTETRAYAVAGCAWVWGAWSAATGISLGVPITALVVGVGAAGQVGATSRLRRLALRRRDALRGLADAGIRTDGTVVSLAGMPWQRTLTVEAADGSGRTWLAEHRDWRALRPAAGHPVALWSTADGVPVIVLAPRPRTSL